MRAHFRWWQSGVIYQIYPRSFMDSNGDGIGDLAGIRARLDYLTWLGVDAIWISPIYPSPMADFGYDVSDYCNVDPRFGTLADFERLLGEAHALGLKVILDYVPNHTSDQHPWFRAARSSRQHPLRDFYIWRDPAPDGGPPNNWLSEFGGPAWELDASGQYYYHAYLKAQPDLNFRNPAVQKALLDVLRFWLDLGVDGFRVDTIHHLIKDDEFRDNPLNPEFREGMPPHQRVIRTYTTDRPEVHSAIAAMRGVIDRYPDRVLIGEAYLPIDRLMLYYGADLSGLHLPFNFQLLKASWDSSALGDLARTYEAALPEGAWPNWVLGNHDRPRLASRVGQAQARVAALLLLTLRGTPTLYYGDEIGMENVPIPPDRVQDPWERNVPGLGLGRDPVRTPMQWSAEPNAGFTTGTPWLPLGADFQVRNVAAQRADPESLLTLYRTILALRREEPALSVGSYVPLVLAGNAGVHAFQRQHEERLFTILLNLTHDAQALALPEGLDGATVRLSTHPERRALSSSSTDQRLELLPDEGIVLGPQRR
jgi:alpha-glucosidase